MDKFKKVQAQTIEKLVEIERQLNHAELANIQQQLQPHFLFNSLNSISALTIVKPDEARRMVQLLSDFLRGTLSREKEKMMPLSEEINYLNLYLEIEKIRFGHRLNVDFQIDENCQKFMLPSLILQPIVENAIKYGLYGSTEDVTISVKSICKPHSLEISISNPYTKENEKTSKGLGFGLNSIQRKLYLLYGQNDLLIIDKGETQFTTTLIIPQL
jgi:LytS/YehU family sensor histidine kinase